MRVYDLLLMLYPADYRAEFGAEMRAVFLALAGDGRPRARLLWAEYCGLWCGAARERGRQWAQRAPSLAGGAVFASGMQLLLYWFLLPGRGKGFARVVEQLFTRVFLLCLVVGIVAAQPAKQDAATLELARSIYSRAFQGVREAKTLEDLRKVSDAIDGAEWISVDRFGRTILTKKDADRDLESLLALPPERRAAGMDIIWAEQDADRLIVVAWMMPNEVEDVDKHKVSRGTLIRDLFVKTEDGWRRIRHDKLAPNDLVIAVDGRLAVTGVK